MLLALDVGNTNVTIGVFEEDRIVTAWRLRTGLEQTADEWGIKLRQLLSMAEIPLEMIQGMVVASVVPPVDALLTDMCRRYFRLEPLFVSVNLDLGLKIEIDNPREAGADRLANAAAAAELYSCPAVVVDFGTAMNFDVVSADRAFIGGLICPGIGMSASGLYQKTARLPLVDIRKPENLIGRNTIDCIQNGLYYSIVGAVDSILERLIQDLGSVTRVIATGGHAELVNSRFFHAIDRDLTLKGLKLIWTRNRN